MENHLLLHNIISQKSKYINDICLTNDSIKIKKIGINHGLFVPFLSKNLHNSVLTINVVKDAIKIFEKYCNTKYDYILLYSQLALSEKII